ncbi:MULTISPECIES: PsbP-related protein [unclassified Methanobrevibacter]|uniref:PsbP-related protein n=1 Tax=unclassified Methanobrevibacter TaxID=2638681 RepID=UPI0025D3D74E|nr:MULTISPECIES: PsbP-related protein [unclassified Methanobrevibacter]MEE0942539.1 PsbP-related protein [Methanobrevibacter sp.]
MRTFNSGKITFEYPDEWEVEKADILSNPDCIATLSKGQDNLINAVMFPTATNLDDYKIFMEDAISDDGGVIIASDFVEIAGLDSIKLHANMDTPEINFDIHTYVFIENGEIYIFELRTLDVSGESERQFKNIIQSFKILK